MLNTPYDISPDTQISIEFLAMNNEHLIISQLEIIEPYEIKDTNVLGKKNLIFKEIFYVKNFKIFLFFFRYLKKSFLLLLLISVRIILQKMILL